MNGTMDDMVRKAIEIITTDTDRPVYLLPDPPPGASRQALNLASKSIRYLWDKMYNNKVFGSTRVTFLAPAEEHAEVKSIGKKLHEEGGIQLMQYVAHSLLSEVCMHSGEDMTYAKYLEMRSDLRELESAWNGIGNWLS